MENKPKLSLYKELNKSWKVESYLKVNFEKRKQSLVCQLFYGILTLKVETGRYYNINRQDRICDLCNTEVETETYFLFNCKKLADVRLKLIHETPELLQYCTCIDKLKFLLSKPYVLGKYVNVLWKERMKLCNQMTV